MLHKEQQKFLRLPLPLPLLKGDDTSTVSLSKMKPVLNRNLSLSEKFLCVNGEVVPLHAIKAHRRSRGTARRILNLLTPATLPLGKNPSTYQIGAWVGPRPSLYILKNTKITCPHRDLNPGPSNL